MSDTIATLTAPHVLELKTDQCCLPSLTLGSSPKSSAASILCVYRELGIQSCILCGLGIQIEFPDIMVLSEAEGVGVGKVILHNYYTSSCSWRVRMALAFKGIPYEYKAVNISKGEQFSEDFTKLSPLQLVPVLEIDGATLVDSIAILEYLEEKFPERRPLLPADLTKRSHVRQAVFLVAANIQPLQNMGTLKNIEEKLGKEERLKWAQKYIIAGFTALERILEKSAGKYSFGDEVTLADIVLIPQCNRHEVDLAQFPTLNRVYTALLELPEVQDSAPAKQPDFPS